MSEEAKKEEFPVGFDFLNELERAADAGSRSADEFARSSGEELRASVDGLGNVMSLLYRAACCSWGCRGGDHQIEWLTGRVVNQAMSSYRLMRAAYYDESLTLTRGIGEIANLLWLFKDDHDSLDRWRGASRRERLRDFGPAAVRSCLGNTGGLIPIDQERYQRLCEVGTHPIPGFAPGHYSGTGRPVLGVLLQPVGVYVALTELCYSTAMSAVATACLLGLDAEKRTRIVRTSADLIRSLGLYSVLNYEELLQEALDRNQADGTSR